MSVALYRRYRPRRFSDVIGQDYAVRILSNAIDQDRVAHAWLMTGPRGTGKTTLARLVAAAVNAPDKPTSDFDPTETTANRILEGRDTLIVQEINCAQDNGIDRVREMQKSAGMMAADGRTTVFILDEAHSLSNSAANALLKLLEEPPEGNMFILCTTEVDKLMSTLKSRCQRLSLRRPTTAEIAKALERVCEQEKVSFEPGALRLCARAAQGGFRDALNALDSVILSEGKSITESGAASALGLVSDQVSRTLTSGIIAGDGRRLLQGVEELYIQGFDLGSAIEGLISWLRLGYLYSYLGELPEDEQLDAEAAAALAEQAGELGIADTLLCVGWLGQAAKDVRAGLEPRIAFEQALLQCARRQQSVEARLDRLEA